MSIIVSESTIAVYFIIIAVISIAAGIAIGRIWERSTWESEIFEDEEDDFYDFDEE